MLAKDFNHNACWLKQRDAHTFFASKLAPTSSTPLWLGKPAGRRFSRTGSGMALCGDPPNQCRSTGMPSQSEGPSGGARAFCLLSRSSKVTRRQGATKSRRYRSNGYVRIPLVGASLLAKDVNDNACCLDKTDTHTFFASKLAPTSSTPLWLGKPAGRRFSRTGSGMALCGDPPHQCRSTGMPSQSEGPSGGARAFCLLSRSSKVTRRQGATKSRRYRSNGYVRISPVGAPTKTKPANKHRISESHATWLVVAEAAPDQSH